MFCVVCNFVQAVHKKTLFYLEQLVLKHKAHVNATGIKQVHGKPFCIDCSIE